MSYHVHLSQFEGPLDLLLHLIRRDKITIYDIPISHITREYLAYIEIMQELELEVAGEFFVMAATLMRIKAQMLLPRRIEEEEEDPRDELVRNLIEYRKYKEAATHLGEREAERRMIFSRPPVRRSEMPCEQRTMEVTLFDLLGAFKKVLEDLKSQVSYRIRRETITIDDKLGHIRSMLEQRSEILFSELFDKNFDRMDIIVTFLALLEMTRLGELIARQMTSGSDIWLYRSGSEMHQKAREIENGAG